MTTIIGTFASKSEADQAVSLLIREGISKDEISLLMSGTTRDSYLQDESGRAAKAGVAGAAVGGGIGALLAGLTAVGAVAIPGGLLVAGPLIAALSAASVGATVGGLASALVRAGIDEHEAKKYEAELHSGRSVVVVKAGDQTEVALARRILNTQSLATSDTRAAI